MSANIYLCEEEHFIASDNMLFFNKKIWIFFLFFYENVPVNTFGAMNTNTFWLKKKEYLSRTINSLSVCKHTNLEEPVQIWHHCHWMYS